MIDPLIGRAIAAGFALLWLLAAWHKLSAGERFVASLAEYRLLPSGWVRPMARALAIVEAALPVIRMERVEIIATSAHPSPMQVAAAR